jgi:hypothetical protein
MSKTYMTQIQNMSRNEKAQQMGQSTDWGKKI